MTIWCMMMYKKWVKDTVSWKRKPLKISNHIWLNRIVISRSLIENVIHFLLFTWKNHDKITFFPFFFYEQWTYFNAFIFILKKKIKCNSQCFYAKKGIWKFILSLSMQNALYTKKTEFDESLQKFCSFNQKWLFVSISNENIFQIKQYV